MKNKQLVVLFTSGFLLRLLIMPFAMHADLLSMYWRANLMVSHGIWLLPTSQYLGHLVYALNLMVMRLAGFDLGVVFQTSFGLSPTSMTASVGDWLNFIELPNVNELLFWLKLPHLVFDAGTFWIFYMMLKRSKYLMPALSLWWLNPVNLYAFYVFSRHDAVTLFWVMLTVYLAVKRKITISVVSLFAAIQVRVQPLMLAPVFLVDYWQYRRSMKDLIKQTGVGLFVVVGYLAVTRLLPVNQTAFRDFFGDDARRVAVSAVGIPGNLARRGFGGSVLALPVFVLVYGFGLWGYGRQRVKGEQGHMEKLNWWLLVVMAGYFAVSVFSPHYLVWLSLFPVIAVAILPKYWFGYAMAVVGWLVMGVFTGGAFSINQNLFLPISPTLFGTPQLPELVPFARSLYVAGQVVMRLGLGLMVVMALADLRIGEMIRHWVGKSRVWGVSLMVLMFLMMATKVEAALLPVLENGTVTGEVPVSGNVIGQTFRAPTDTFGAVQIKFNTHRLEETTSLLFRIKEIGSDVWLYEGERNPADFYNRAYYPFGFPVVTGALGKSYYFEAEFKGETESLLAVLVNENEYPDGNLRLNDEDVIDLDLAFRVDEAAGVGKVIEAMQKDMGNKISSQAGFFLGYAGLMALVLAGSTVLYLWMNG